MYREHLWTGTVAKLQD